MTYYHWEVNNRGRLRVCCLMREEIFFSYGVNCFGEILPLIESLGRHTIPLNPLMPAIDLVSYLQIEYQ